MSKPEKILHVLNSRVYSGAEAVAAQIIRAFSDRAELAYCSPESEEVSRMLQSQGIRHVRVKTLTPWSLARVIRREKPDLRAAVIGDGELEEDCRRLARELGLTDQVSFLGYRPNPVKILHDSTLIALTSLWEGCGLVVMEAMALGTPAVCTDVDGLRGILLDGETGFYGRTGGELADAMVRILRDPRLRASLSERGRAHFEAINDPESYYRVLSEHYGL